MRTARSLLAAVRTTTAAALLTLPSLGAQTPQPPATAAHPASAAAPATDRAPHPFGPGESLRYEVRFGSLKVGTGTMDVRGIETVRGRPAYHTVFRVTGGTAFFKVNDVFESWFATDDLSSIRFYKDQDEGWKERTKRYDIFPERATFDDLTDKAPEQKSVSNPLDDGSFLYFIRTVPLAVGQTYHFDRYYLPDRNPVTIKVLRRERVKVPAGAFDCAPSMPLAFMSWPYEATPSASRVRAIPSSPTSSTRPPLPRYDRL